MIKSQFTPNTWIIFLVVAIPIITFHCRQAETITTPYTSCLGNIGGAALPLSYPFFQQVNEQVGLPAVLQPFGGTQVIDLNLDGYDDLIPENVYSALINTGNGTFIPASASTGFDNMVGGLRSFADINMDGNWDFYTRGTEFVAPGIYLGDGLGNFSGNDAINAGVEYTSDIHPPFVETISFMDLDGNGKVDLYVATRLVKFFSTGLDFFPIDYLYSGRGDGTFIDKTDVLGVQTHPDSLLTIPSIYVPGRSGYSISMADFDNDSDMDIFINNYGSGRPAIGVPPPYLDQNFLWRNDGNFSFVDVAAEKKVNASERGIGGVEQELPITINGVTYPGPVGGNGFGVEWGDFNNDGYLDLIVGNIAHPDHPASDRLLLQVNQGPPNYDFKEESLIRGLEYREDEIYPDWIDVNNDGLLDLSCAGLRPQGSGGNEYDLYMQQSGNTFVKASSTESGVVHPESNHSIWVDFDNDGDLDLLLPGNDTLGAQFYENKVADGNNWLVIRMQQQGRADAPGSRVTLDSSMGIQTREIVSTQGRGVQETQAAYFGLGQDTCAENVNIRWPNGENQNLGNVAVNQVLLLEQDTSIEILK